MGANGHHSIVYLKIYYGCLTLSHQLRRPVHRRWFMASEDGISYTTFGQIFVLVTAFGIAFVKPTSLPLNSCI